MEDNRIVELYLRRDESALALSAAKYGARLRALAYGIVGDVRTAEECENDSYLQAWDLIPPHEPRSYLYAFLARIARHISLDRCRELHRLKRRAFISELSAEMEQCIPAPENGGCRLEDIILRDALNTFLRSLSAQRRRMFLRRYWYGDSVAEISKGFGVSESKVKTTLHRCRKQLREYLEKEGYEL